MVLGPVSNSQPTPSRVQASSAVPESAPAAEPNGSTPAEAPSTPAVAQDASAVESRPTELAPDAAVNLDDVVVPVAPPSVASSSSSASPCPTEPPPPVIVEEPPHPPVAEEPLSPPVVHPPVTEEPLSPPVEPPPSTSTPPCPTEPTAPPVVHPPVSQPPVEPPRPTSQPPVEPSKPKPVVAQGRTFSTQGDPIIRTGDGMQFSINKPGKYTSLKSASGDFVMQQQVSLTQDKRHYNTGIGFKIGKDTLAFDTDGGKGMATLKVNGQDVKLGFKPLTMKLPDGGTLSYDPKTNKIKIKTPEGDNLTVHRAYNAAKTHYLNVKVEMAEKRPAGSVAGVLGTMDEDGSAKNDARMRDGSVFKGLIGSLWKTPEKFIEEWRSRPEENIL